MVGSVKSHDRQVNWGYEHCSLSAIGVDPAHYRLSTLTEVIWHILRCNRPICSRSLFPLSTEVRTILANECELRAKWEIEPSDIYEDVYFDELSDGSDDTSWHNFSDFIDHNSDVALGERLQVSIPRRWASTANCELRYDELSERVIGSKFGLHVVCQESSGRFLLGGAFVELKVYQNLQTFTPSKGRKAYYFKSAAHLILDILSVCQILLWILLEFLLLLWHDCVSVRDWRK